MSNFKKQNILTVEELAELLRVEKGTIYKLVKAGKLPAFKIGRVWRFNAEEVAHWMHSASHSAATETVDEEDPDSVGIRIDHSEAPYALAAARNGHH